MASLTELCSICFTNPPKYTCPRCGCQTCSLACVKTHKKRAACSGIRNPAAYLKSSELATPASIDRDYNFITKLQRGIEQADDDVAERGITLVPARNGKNAHAGKSKLEVEYEACSVTVVKAPVGLTRSKQNKTHWDKRHNCVMWTVEWVLQNDQRVLANVQSGKTVIDAFTNGVGKKGLQRKRKLGEVQQEEEERPPKPKETKRHEEPVVQQPAAEKPDEEQHKDPADPVETKESAGVSPPQNTAKTNAGENAASQMHFYLHRPRTSSKHTCLIPIPPSTSVSDILRDRTILEYPTIYARPEAEDELISPFITEKAYEEQYGIDVVPRTHVVGQEYDVHALGGIPDHIDERKIMEVLKRDIVG
jgi:hypothetical protein